MYPVHYLWWVHYYQLTSLFSLQIWSLGEVGKRKTDKWSAKQAASDFLIKLDSFPYLKLDKMNIQALEMVVIYGFVVGIFLNITSP